MCILSYFNPEKTDPFLRIPNLDTNKFYSEYNNNINRIFNDVRSNKLNEYFVDNFLRFMYIFAFCKYMSIYNFDQISCITYI